MVDNLEEGEMITYLLRFVNQGITPLITKFPFNLIGAGQGHYASSMKLNGIVYTVVYTTKEVDGAILISTSDISGEDANQYLRGEIYTNIEYFVQPVPALDKETNIFLKNNEPAIREHLSFLSRGKVIDFLNVIELDSNAVRKRLDLYEKTQFARKMQGEKNLQEESNLKKELGVSQLDEWEEIINKKLW